MMSKRDAVMANLKVRAMTVNELAELFRPRITYAYIRTMVCKMHKDGLLDVEVEQFVFDSGGSREVYRYKAVENPPPKPEFEDDDKEDILPVRRKIQTRGRRLIHPCLTMHNISTKTRKELMVKVSPLYGWF
jgi:hypothetical protein